MIRRPGWSRLHSLTITDVNVVKVALRALLTIASKVGGTSSVRVLGPFAMSTFPRSFILGLLQACPFISLDPFIWRQLTMDKRAFIGFLALSLRELEAWLGARIEGRRLEVISLAFPVSLGSSLALALSFPLSINMSRSNKVRGRRNVRSRGDNRTLSIGIVSILALGSLFAASLTYPMGAMLLARLSWGGRRGLTGEP